MIDGRHVSSVLDLRTIRGPRIASDHVVARLRWSANTREVRGRKAAITTHSQTGFYLTCSPALWEHSSVTRYKRIAERHFKLSTYHIFSAVREKRWFDVECRTHNTQEYTCAVKKWKAKIYQQSERTLLPLPFLAFLALDKKDTFLKIFNKTEP